MLMLHWAVVDVVAFFESKDAYALGKSLAVNRLQGADLLRLMLRWAAADVVALFESKDADALGKSLAANGLQRADMFRFALAPLREDLNFNSFAAQKICDLRDAFLH